jgi:hypothetical protein
MAKPTGLGVSIFSTGYPGSAGGPFIRHTQTGRQIAYQAHICSYCSAEISGDRQTCKICGAPSGS